MYNLNGTTSIEQDDVTYILEPVLRNTKELLQLPIPDELKEITLKHQLEMVEKYDKEATKIYQITPELIGIRALIENYTQQMHIDESDDRVNNLLTKIDLFVKGNLLLKVEVPETRLQLSPDFKLLIAPLGILFLHCFYSKPPPLRKNLTFSSFLLHANQLLGSVYNHFMLNRVSDYLNQAKANLNKREIVLTLFLLLSQATSPGRAIRLGKPANGDLLVPLRYVANAVFPEEPQLFPDRGAVDNAVRRSTGAGGLQGKTSMLFFKEETEDKSGYLLYFHLARVNRERDHLSFVVHRLFESTKTFEEREGNPYRKRVIELVDKHVNDRNLIFESKPYVRQKILLNPSITTDYLRILFGIMKGFHD